MCASIFFCFVVFVVGVWGASEDVEWNYKQLGRDWPGQCEKGKSQSPINLPISNTEFFEIIPEALQASFDFGQSDNVRVVDNGHTIGFDFVDNFSDIRIPIVNNEFMGIISDDLLFQPDVEVKIVPAKLENFHIHSPSEHTYDGALALAEGHFVMSISNKDLPSCPDIYCFAVLSVRFQYDPFNTENMFFKTVLDNIGGQYPYKAGMAEQVNTTLDFNQLLPNDMQYVMYNGSLTTPPCSENVLWHVVKQPNVISIDQLYALQYAMSLTNKDVKAQQFEVQIGKDAKVPVTLGFTKSNELFVGRLAMIGFAASILGELLTGKGALAQFGLETGIPIQDTEPLVIGLVIFNLVAALLPAKGTFVPEEEEDRPEGSLQDPSISILQPKKFFGISGFGFTKANELFVGRVAQLGFAFSLIGEAITGKGPLAQFDIETGLPLADTEPLLLAFIVFTLFAAINEGSGRFKDE